MTSCKHLTFDQTLPRCTAKSPFLKHVQTSTFTCPNSILSLTRAKSGESPHSSSGAHPTFSFRAQNLTPSLVNSPPPTANTYSAYNTPSPGRKTSANPDPSISRIYRHLWATTRQTPPTLSVPARRVTSRLLRVLVLWEGFRGRTRVLGIWIGCYWRLAHRERWAKAWCT